ncbi:MAG: SRPBCC family protein [Bacteroidota bacterium]
MHTYTRTVEIAAPIESVFHFHNDPQNLLKISPPGINVKIEHSEPTALGAKIILKVSQFGIIKMLWKMQFTEYEPPFRMTDEMLSGPFKTWIQRRELSFKNGKTFLNDSLDYELPFGFLGNIANALVVKYIIKNMFEYRQRKTKELLEK